MASTPYTMLKLITNAFYLSGVRSQGFQDLSDEDTSVGIDLLNEVLAELDINTRMIPYYKEYETPAIYGQEEYFIPYLVEPSTVTFNIGTVRWSIKLFERNQYHGGFRVDGIPGLPFTGSFEKSVGGCSLYLYFLPCSDYVLKIWGKFGFQELDVSQLTENLLDVYDLWFVRYLRYSLAREICNQYKSPVSQEIERVLGIIEASVNDMNKIDLTPRRVNLYNGCYAGNNYEKEAPATLFYRSLDTFH